MNSRRKGKRGELEAAQFLRSLGFASARRSQQFCGRGRTSDLIVEELPHVHLEVKFGYPLSAFDLGLAGWENALRQASRDADGGPFAVLWKPKGSRCWRCTTWDGLRYITVVGAEPIRELLLWLNDCADHADP